MPGSGRPTRAQDVYAGLRADIAAARFKPGERLKAAELCERYGASVSVVREALSGLATERFVRLQPRYGYTVTPLSADELEDLTRARLLVEGGAIRESVRAGGVDWQAEVVAAHHRLAALSVPARHDEEVERWYELHEVFHSVLVGACPSRRLRETVRVLRQEAELYRRWATRLGSPRKTDVAAEHQALVDAALAGRAEAAEALLKDHIQRTNDSLVPLLNAENLDVAIDLEALPA